MANFAVDRIVVEELFALGTLSVIIIAAMIADIDVVAVLVYSKGNFIGKEIFVALCAKQVLVSKATRTDIGAVVDKSHPASVKIFLAMFTKAIILIQAVVADVDTLAMTINNLPSFRSIIFALLTEFAVVVVAVIAKKLRIKFAGARNAKSVSTNIENLVVVLMVLTNGNFSVEVGVAPIRITAKTVTARDVNAMFVAAIFFGLPEIGHAFKLGNFALNQIAIKF